MAMQRISCWCRRRVAGDAGPSLFLVPAGASGISACQFDAGCAAGADIEFANVAVGADALIGERSAAAAIDYALDRRPRCALRRSRGRNGSEPHKITVEYLKTRKQFGRVIGMNQALQHRGGHADARRKSRRWQWKQR